MTVGPSLRGVDLSSQKSPDEEGIETLSLSLRTDISGGVLRRALTKKGLKQRLRVVSHAKIQQFSEEP